MHHRTKKRLDYGDRAAWFGKTALRLLGWTSFGEKPDIDKSMIICAPHTSNWDIFFSLLASFALRIPVVFMMKSSWFVWPLAPVLYWLGGIPIDRSKRSSTVNQMADAFRESPKLRVLIAPSGTRKHVQYWKTGFYWIAKEANVPLVLALINYKDKRIGLGPVLEVTGDLAADFAKLQAFYQEQGGFRPEYRKDRDEVPSGPPEKD